MEEAASFLYRYSYATKRDCKIETKIVHTVKKKVFVHQAGDMILKIFLLNTILKDYCIVIWST